MEYDWRHPFQQLNVAVRFESVEKSPQLIEAHLNRLKQSTKIVLFVTETLSVENYVLAAQSDSVKRNLIWIVVTKDQSPFKCPNCHDAKIYWISLAKSTSNEVLSKFAEFIWPDKLEQQFLFARESRNQLRTAYCLDMMYDVLDYLIGLNKRNVNMTVSEILKNNTDHDFGAFVYHSGNLYYQV
jgi:predicted RNA-binding Zn-ribbon protein involved in translation (DUF1610 family)